MTFVEMIFTMNWKTDYMCFILILFTILMLPDELLVKITQFLNIEDAVNL